MYRNRTLILNFLQWGMVVVGICAILILGYITPGLCWIGGSGIIGIARLWIKE